MHKINIDNLTLKEINLLQSILNSEIEVCNNILEELKKSKIKTEEELYFKKKKLKLTRIRGKLRIALVRYQRSMPV